MLGALVYALVGGGLLFSSLTSVLIAVREVREGSGGIGAVSIGISESLVELGVLVVPVAALVANRMLAPWVRRSEGAIKTIHRAQLWSWIVAIGASVATPAIFLMSLPGIAFAWLPVDGVLWGVQFLLTAVLLVAYARRPEPLDTTRIVRVTAPIAALLFGLYGAFALRGVASSVTFDARPLAGYFVAGEFISLFPFLFVAIANRLLARWARASSGIVAMLHLATSVTMVLSLGLTVAGYIGASNAWYAFGGQTWMIVSVARGLSMAAMFLLSAALLGVYALKTARSG
jgi:hypothetical protein